MPPARSFGEAIRTAATKPVAVIALLLLAACASRQPAPVEDRTPRPPPPPVVAAPPADAVPPGVVYAPPTYTVKRGDTLRTIATAHGLDFRELAAWNNLEKLNVLRVGQVLRLSSPNEPVATAAGVQTTPLRTVPPVGSADAPLASAPSTPGAGTIAPAAPMASVPPPSARNSETYKTQPKAIKEPYSEQALRDAQRGAASASTTSSSPAPQVASATPQVAPAVASAAAPAAESPPAVARIEPRPVAPPPDGDERVEWVWPAKGKIVTGFSEASSLKGIDIAGSSGQPITASAGGKVVYAGTGLRGYGKLIIIKHNGTYLSAYAHNREILVKEGQQVAKGQKIAEMGNTDADQVKLHFEIRRQGKPVDPLRYLPPA
jgi:lipoprotein NlpD